MSIKNVIYTPTATAIVFDEFDGGNCNRCDSIVAGIISKDGSFSYKHSHVGYHKAIDISGGAIIFSPTSHRGVDYGWEYLGDKWEEYKHSIQSDAATVTKDCKGIYSTYLECSPSGANGFSDLCMACQSWPEMGQSKHNWSLHEFRDLCHAYNNTGAHETYNAFAQSYCK